MEVHATESSGLTETPEITITLTAAEAESLSFVFAHVPMNIAMTSHGGAADRIMRAIEKVIRDYA